jgi:hypothetical protein
MQSSDHMRRHVTCHITAYETVKCHHQEKPASDPSGANLLMLMATSSQASGGCSRHLNLYAEGGEERIGYRLPQRTACPCEMRSKGHVPASKIQSMGPHLHDSCGSRSGQRNLPCSCIRSRSGLRVCPARPTTERPERSSKRDLETQSSTAVSTDSNNANNSRSARVHVQRSRQLSRYYRQVNFPTRSGLPLRHHQSLVCLSASSVLLPSDPGSNPTLLTSEIRPTK